ncbi:amidohydrolase [Ottowia thiooxydans]|uniref:amidohydrolase n=1 Tax=Ottowia thiooxydans TaxID=219182 RepID=UPI0003F83BD8|nr:amidohydrolase [Ottowia thiooxydans]
MKLDLNQDGILNKLVSIRRDIHANPEFGFQETRTAGRVAAFLTACGIPVTTGVGGTGVVGTLKRGTSNRSIILRADMDALKIQETPAHTRAHGSLNPGYMHACGHDGHTTMLLGAAQVLAAQGGFDGTVQFVFQPAEEWGKGMLAMLEDGLLERFPASEAYGLHNVPGLAIGKFETRAGAFRSAEDNFTINIRGKSVHSARPQQGRDALVAAAAVITALQTIISRVITPGEQAVVSCTDIKVPGIRNVICGEAEISGDCRSFSPQVSALIERELRTVAENVSRAHGCEALVEYTREFVPTVNHPELAMEVGRVLTGVFGVDAVDANARPQSGSEDFGQLLLKIPGCFVNIGNGATESLHNSAYDFNDEAIPFGVEFFATVARARLPLTSR